MNQFYQLARARVINAINTGYTHFGTGEVGTGCAFCVEEDIPRGAVWDYHPLGTRSSPDSHAISAVQAWMNSGWSV